MHRFDSKMRIFAVRNLSYYLDSRSQTAGKSVQIKDPNYLLNVSEQDYIDHLHSVYSVQPISIQIDKVAYAHTEESIPLEQLYPGKRHAKGLTERKTVVTISIPYAGSEELLWCCPFSKALELPPIALYTEYFTIEYIFPVGSTEAFDGEFFRDIENIAKSERHVNQKVTEFNKELSLELPKVFASRKSQILTLRNQIASIGVPLIHTAPSSNSFAVPNPRHLKKIVPAPIVTANDYVPHPELLEDDFVAIVSTIDEAGRIMEQHPSLYVDKDENSLRDLFLFYLTPRFEGEASAETFNSRGKTDILLTYQSSVVFVAECKIWSGRAAFRGNPKNPGAIDQLLKYLTWRNSKAAILLFVKTTNMAKVANEVKAEVERHPNFKGVLQERTPNWFEYRFHLHEDSNTEFKLAVLLFQFHLVVHPVSAGGRTQ